jgi:ATP/maltotriose-dependent transcriptional regulator MalT
MTIAVQHPTHPKNPPKILFELSARELEVLLLAAEGLSNKEIAEALFLSCDTIDTHNRNLIGKCALVT